MNLATNEVPYRTTVRSSPRRLFFGTALAYVACNVVLAVVGLVVKLPATNSTHAVTNHITIGQVLVGSGTAMTPPLYCMVILGALLWTATSRNTLLSRAATILATIGVLYLAIYGVATLFGARPANFSSGMWELAVALAVVFAAFSVAVIASALAWLVRRPAWDQVSARTS